MRSFQWSSQPSDLALLVMYQQLVREDCTYSILHIPQVRPSGNMCSMARSPRPGSLSHFLESSRDHESCLTVK